MLSEKLITMMSGVITLRNMLRRKPSHPSAPSAKTIARSGGAGGDQHQRQAAEEKSRDRASERETDGVVEDTVALEGVADFELHDRHARQLRREAGPLQVFLHRPADVVHNRLELAAVDDGGFERKDRDGEPAVVREQLAADDLVGLHLVDERMVGAPFRQGVGKEGLRETALRGGLAQGKHREERRAFRR